MDDCPTCMHSSELTVCAKPCWKTEGTYCQADADDIAPAVNFVKKPDQITLNNKSV